VFLRIDEIAPQAAAAHRFETQTAR
jgi:hypothetical protein